MKIEEIAGDPDSDLAGKIVGDPIQLSVGCKMPSRKRSRAPAFRNRGGVEPGGVVRVLRVFDGGKRFAAKWFERDGE